MAKTDRTGRNLPHVAVIHARYGDVRGAGNMFTTTELRRGRPTDPGNGTVYRDWYAAMAVAERYAAQHGGKAGTQLAD
jgi:hypothetical protein